LAESTTGSCLAIEGAVLKGTYLLRVSMAVRSISIDCGAALAKCLFEISHFKMFQDFPIKEKSGNNFIRDRTDFFSY